MKWFKERKTHEKKWGGGGFITSDLVTYLANRFYVKHLNNLCFNNVMKEHDTTLVPKEKQSHLNKVKVTWNSMEGFLRCWSCCWLRHWWQISWFWCGRRSWQAARGIICTICAAIWSVTTIITAVSIVCTIFTTVFSSSTVHTTIWVRCVRCSILAQWCFWRWRGQWQLNVWLWVIIATSGV